MSDSSQWLRDAARKIIDGIADDRVIEVAKLYEAADKIDRLQEAKRAALKIADERAKEASALRQALKQITDLQDRSLISGDGKFMRALMIARAALTDEKSDADR